MTDAAIIEAVQNIRGALANGNPALADAYAQDILSQFALAADEQAFSVADAEAVFSGIANDSTIDLTV